MKVNIIDGRIYDIMQQELCKIENYYKDLWIGLNDWKIVICKIEKLWNNDICLMGNFMPVYL